MNAKEILELLSKPWCTVYDIKAICNCGMNKAVTIRSQLRKKLQSEGKIVANNLIPMTEFIKAFSIDIEYLEKMANRNK